MFPDNMMLEWDHNNAFMYFNHTEIFVKIVANFDKKEGFFCHCSDCILYQLTQILHFHEGRNIKDISFTLFDIFSILYVFIQLYTCTNPCIQPNTKPLNSKNLLDITGYLIITFL